MNTGTVSWRSWCYEFKRFARPEAIVLLCLGFSAGLPFLLVSGTLSAWLKDAGLEYGAIGFFAWVGLAFSIKFLWAPFIDRIQFPLLCSWLGHRRGWLLAAQIGVAAGLMYMSTLSPSDHTALLALAAVLVAFCAATQDVSLDAYRIQSVSSGMQGVVTSAYIAGYRIALLASGAGALIIADLSNWQISYQVMSLLMGVGMLTVLIMREPEVIRQPDNAAARHQLWCDTHLTGSSERVRRVMVWVLTNLIEPFTEMMARHGKWFVLLLLVVLFYRVSDIAMGNMANPFYLALGYSKTDIASVSKVLGLVMVLIGSAVGGIFVARLGLFRSMAVCLVGVILTNLLFSALAVAGASCLQDVNTCHAPSLWWLSWVISADNLAAGASNVVFIAFLSNQVSLAYSATQYALLSSLMTLLGKFVSGFSGVVVDVAGFPVFFIYVSLWGVPSLLLLMTLKYWNPACFRPLQSTPDISEY